MQQVAKCWNVARSKGWVTREWTASVFRNVIIFLHWYKKKVRNGRGDFFSSTSSSEDDFCYTELLHVYFGRSNVVFAILFCFVQNKFVFCKAIVGFYFGIVMDNVFGCYRFQKNNMFLIVSKVEIFGQVSCVVCCFFIEN